MIKELLIITATRFAADNPFQVQPPPSLDNTPSSINDIIQPVVKTLLYVVGISSVIVIIIAGFLYVTSAGDPAKTKAAKDAILYAVIGLVVSMMSFAIASFIFNKF